MIGIDALVHAPLAQAVAWALVQFVWQGALVAALTAVALTTLRRSAADVRYIVATTALAVMVTLPAVSGAQRYRELTARQSTAGTVVAGDTMPLPAARRAAAAGALAARAAAGAAVPSPAPADGARWQPVLLLAWLSGVAILTLRLLTGWIWVTRLRTHRAAAAGAAWQEMSARLCRRLHISRTVTLLESAMVEVPTVIGWLRPIILLPVTALSGLAPAQLEAILAHELAHIRRQDYLVNLLQTAVETLLFYHPAVWWLSRRIRIEREHCCDDLAVSLCGDPIAYAGALADMESLRGSGLVLAANGGSLVTRVKRLLGAPASHAGRGPAWLAGTLALVLVCGFVAYASGRAAPRAGTLTSVPLPSVGAAVQETLATTAAPAPRHGGVLAAAGSGLDSIGTGLDRATSALDDSTTALGESVDRLAASAEAAAQSIHLQNDGSSGNMTWSHNGHSLAVDYKGSFEIADDDTDVTKMSPGAWLKITDGGLLGRHTVEITEKSGQVEHRYYVNGSERPFDPEGRQWLRENLPTFVRNTGFAADARVARFLKNGGPAAVLAEISRIDSDWVKGIYFTQLMKQASLTPDQYRQVMAQAGHDMHSDFELARLLTSTADRMPNDDASQAAYFQAASNLSSDFEAGRVYAALLARRPVSSAVVAGILTNAKKIRSDFELSRLLQQVVAQQPLDDRTRPLFFDAASKVGSDFEHHRVLSAALRSGDPATAAAALAQADRIGSDFERAALLSEVLRAGSIEGPQRQPFFKALSGVGSSFERGRVLVEIVRRPEASHDTLLDAVQATSGMGDYETSQVLVAAARSHEITGDVRDAYVKAAERLGSFEQGHAMTALVRSEGRK